VRTELQIGAQLETLTRGELSSELAAQTQEIYRQQARGCKYMRLAPAQATIASNAFSLDGTQTSGLGPREGFVWTIRRLAVAGLTAGTTPDVVNIYRNSPTGLPVWQLNGNNWGTTFGKCELLLLGGETLSIASLGTIAATGKVTLTGDLLEVPAEEIFKLF
jgi:hypothetical protein